MNILSKKRFRNERVIYLFGKKIYSYSKKSNNINKFNFSIFEYIDRFYKEIIIKYDAESTFLTEPVDNVLETDKQYIFQYWNSGIENAPRIVKSCFDSIEEYCRDKEIVRLNDSNLHNYISIPEYIKKKYDIGIISKAHYSDYIRTCLLYKYGGYWCDATVYLTGPISPKIAEADFFMFKSSSFNTGTLEYRDYVPSIKMLDVFKDMPCSENPLLCGSNWFLHARNKNNRIFGLMKKFLEEYWKKEDRVIDYFLYHYMLSYIIITDNESQNIFKTMPSMTNIAPHILQNVLYDTFNSQLYSEIIKLTTIHKLTYQKQKDIEGTFLEKIIS